MADKHEPVRAKDFYIRPSEGGEVRVTTEETQLEKLEKKVTTLEQALSSIAMELKSKVDSDNVIAAINISPEDIRIKGSAIHLDGETLIDDAAVVEMDGKKIANSLYRKTRLKR